MSKYLLIIHFIFKHILLAQNRPESDVGGSEIAELLFVALFRELSNWKISDSSSTFFSDNSRPLPQDSYPGNIEERVEPDNIVSTDTFKGYNALGISVFHHHRINHLSRLTEQANHLNGIENFWNQAKRHLQRFNGIKPGHFYWFLKECEWRFNGGNHRKLLSQLIHWVNEAKNLSENSPLI